MERNPSMTPSAQAEMKWAYRSAAALLILATAILRLYYLAADCPFDLAPDEAHYWDWSRHLDWSYYSKGPLVAYLIRLGTWFCGMEAYGVRFPAVVCGMLLMSSLYVLTVQVLGREKLAFFVVALATTLPPVAAGAAIMTIDGPYTCLWGWALVLGHAAIFGHRAWAWPLAGLVLGAGMLAKYTMLLWLPSAFLFLLFTREFRPLLFRPGFWVMTAVAGFCCLPILIWNANHDWVTFRHVSGQAGLTPKHAGIRWFGPLNFAATQCALLLVFWFFVWVAAMWTHRPWREADAGKRYLWWMSAPMFTFFLLFGFKTGGGEPNWPITAYLSGLVLMVGWLTEQIRIAEPFRRRALIASTACTVVIGMAVTVVMHHTDWVQPLLARVSGEPTPSQPYPLRRFDPTCRLRGWKHLASEVDRVREEVRATGAEPILAGTGWAMPGELGFYCAGNPIVYSMGLALGDRWSQYDFWRPNPVQDSSHFRDSTFVIVGGGVDRALAEAFETVEPPRLITYEENGHTIAHWCVTVCHGFRGSVRLPTNAPH